MADENSISSLADAFREQRYLTYAEEELSPARDNFGRWFGTPYGYVADPDEGLPDELFGRAAEVASSAAGNGGKEEEANEPEEPHWVITEIEDNPAKTPTYESVETARQSEIDEMNDIIKRNNLPIRISSGYREPGKAGKLGDKSLHTKLDENGDPLAVDVTMLSGVTPEEAVAAMANCDEWVQMLKRRKKNVLQEWTEEERKKYGATGVNWHLAPVGGEEVESYYSKFRTASRHGGRIERGLDYMRMLRQYGQ